jgi:predicted RNA-binding Zn-ribbon protein involved in translation (DUF1610 family)
MNYSHEAEAWNCTSCGAGLVVTKVFFTYMKGNFEVDLPACPECGLVLVPEDLVRGKMVEAERILEDK